MKKREFDKEGNLVCTICNEILKPAAPATDLFAAKEAEDAVVVGKEPCSQAAGCLSADSDCTEEGAKNREFACFEGIPTMSEDSGLFTAGEETNDLAGVAEIITEGAVDEEPSPFGEALGVAGETTLDILDKVDAYAASSQETQHVEDPDANWPMAANEDKS